MTTDSNMLAVARNTRERGILHQWVGRAIVPFDQYGVEHIQIPNDPAKEFAPGNGPNSGLLFPPEQTSPFAKRDVRFHCPCGSGAKFRKLTCFLPFSKLWHHCRKDSEGRLG